MSIPVIYLGVAGGNPMNKHERCKPKKPNGKKKKSKMNVTVANRKICYGENHSHYVQTS